jgi:hypothetical protein
MREFHKSINLNDFKHTVPLQEGQKGGDYGSETGHNYTNWDLNSELKGANSILDLESALDHTERIEEKNEKVDNSGVNKQFYTNIGLIRLL